MTSSRSLFADSLTAAVLAAATSLAFAGPATTASSSGQVPPPTAAKTAGAANKDAEHRALVVGNNITVTAADVIADVRQRVPAEVQDQLLAQESTVSQIAGNLYARRAMADLAKAKGLEDDPQIVAALRVARDKILSDAWVAQIDSQHQITDAVAEGFARNAYSAKPDRFKVGEQVRVRHILVAGQTPEMRAQAEQLLDELKKGADFAQLAKDRSADKASGAKGGDLGFFERGRMLPEFEAAAFALRERGQLSDVVSTQYGYHIIQLEESKPAGVRPFSEVRDELIKEVRGTVLQEARVAEAQRLQQGMQIQRDAVKEFTSGFPPVEVKRP